MYANFSIVFLQHFILASVVGVEVYGAYFGIYAIFGAVESAFTSRNGDIQLGRLRKNDLANAEAYRNSELLIGLVVFLVGILIAKYLQLDQIFVISLLLAVLPVLSIYPHNRAKFYVADKMEMLSKIELICAVLQLVFMTFGGYFLGVEGMAAGYLLYSIIKSAVFSCYGDSILPTKSYRPLMRHRFHIGGLQAARASLINIFQNIDIIVINSILPESSVGIYKLHKVFASAAGKLSAPVWRVHNARIINAAMERQRLFDNELWRAAAFAVCLQIAAGFIIAAVMLHPFVMSLLPFDPNFCILFILFFASMLYFGVCGWLSVYVMASPSKLFFIFAHAVGIAAVLIFPNNRDLIGVAGSYALVVLCLVVVSTCKVNRQVISVFNR